ncbi:MAG: hypothetical protein IPK68_20720 [Bdellovibrionales bacterium]|nr:hypothetical protein [Bdellovibrionales bacterium]
MDFLITNNGCVENAESVNEVDKIAHLLSQLSVMKRKVRDKLVIEEQPNGQVIQGRMTKNKFLT